MHISSTSSAFGQTCQKQLSTSSSQSVVMTAAAQKQYTRQPSWQLRRKHSKHSQKYKCKNFVQLSICKNFVSRTFPRIQYSGHHWDPDVCPVERGVLNSEVDLLGQQTVSSFERCTLFRVSFVDRLHCSESAGAEKPTEGEILC